MAEDDFLMGDDLFGSDFEDLISKDDLITTEGLNYFLGADDQSNSRIRSGSVSDADSFLSLSSSIDARGLGSRQKSDKGGMLWESSLDMPTFDFDSSGESFIFPDSVNQSDSDFSTNNLAFPINSSIKSTKKTKAQSQGRAKAAVSKRNASNNRKSKATASW